MRKMVTSILMVLLLGSCAVKNEKIIQSHKQGSLHELGGKKLSLNMAEFNDWAYPDKEQLELFCANQPQLMPLAFSNEKYHGVKLIIYDYENMPFEIDESDDSIIYGEAEPFKVIAFFPRNKRTLAKRFKRYYVSKKSLHIRGKCIGVLPKDIWLDTQIQEEDMPVILLKAVF